MRVTLFFVKSIYPHVLQVHLVDSELSGQTILGKPIGETYLRKILSFFGKSKNVRSFANNKQMR